MDLLYLESYYMNYKNTNSKTLNKFMNMTLINLVSVTNL